MYLQPTVSLPGTTHYPTLLCTTLHNTFKLHNWQTPSPTNPAPIRHCEHNQLVERLLSLQRNQQPNISAGLFVNWSKQRKETKKQTRQSKANPEQSGGSFSKMSVSSQWFVVATAPYLICTFRSFYQYQPVFLLKRTPQLVAFLIVFQVQLL